MNKRKISLIKILILLAFVILGFTLFRAFGPEIFKIENIRETISSYGAFGPLIFIAIYVLGAVIFFPGTPLTISSGILFGTINGTIYTVIGATIGASIAFLISRLLGKDFIDRLLKNKLKKLNEYDKRIKENGFLVMIFLRLIPLFPFNGLNFAMGLTRIKFRQFLLGTVIGIVPGTFVLANIGSSAKDIRSPMFYLSIFLFLLLALMPLIYKRISIRRKNKSEIN